MSDPYAFAGLHFLLKQNISRKRPKKGKRKVQGVPQSQTAALSRPQEEEETDKQCCNCNCQRACRQILCCVVMYQKTAKGVPTCVSAVEYSQYTSVELNYHDESVKSRTCDRTQSTNFNGHVT